MVASRVLHFAGYTFADYDVSRRRPTFRDVPGLDTEASNRGIVTLVTPWFDQLAGRLRAGDAYCASDRSSRGRTRYAGRKIER